MTARRCKKYYSSIIKYTIGVQLNQKTFQGAKLSDSCSPRPVVAQLIDHWSGEFQNRNFLPLDARGVIVSDVLPASDSTHITRVVVRTCCFQQVHVLYIYIRIYRRARKENAKDISL